MPHREPPPDDSSSYWHWDKRVPIALIVTLLATFICQGSIGIWWASKMDARVEALEKQTAAQSVVVAPQGDRLTRLEVKVESVQSGISEIKTILREQSNKH